MIILVAVKAVADYSLPVRLKPDGSGIETAHVRKVINPFDEIAVEEGIRLKEKGLAESVVAVSIGAASAADTLRHALAMGADRGILIETVEGTGDCPPLATAGILATLAKQEKATLCLLGKQAVDTDNNQTGQMLAGLLGWAQGTFASRIVLNEQGVEVTREVDGGLETVQLTLPAVITTDLRLNQPRYLSLPNIVQAKRKPLSVLSSDSFDTGGVRQQQVCTFSLPVRARKNIRVTTATELLSKLRETGRVP